MKDRNHWDYSRFVEEASVWVERACNPKEGDDTLKKRALKELSNYGALTQDEATAKDVVECLKATRAGLDWRGMYCLRHSVLESLNPHNLAHKKHRAAIKNAGEHESIYKSLAEYHHDMVKTLQWAAYGNVTIKVAIDEWNRLELKRLTELVNG